MSAFLRWMPGREYIRLLLNWRWLVLFVAMPVSFVIEFIEELGPELDLLDEVAIDGIVIPITTWLVLTFAARRMADQLEREDVLERRQQFARGVAEHREFDDLARFLVRFPASLLPIAHVKLDIFHPQLRRPASSFQWMAPGESVDGPPQYYLVLIHDTVQVGALQLVFPPDRRPSATQIEELSALVPDIAAALARAIAGREEAEQAYQEARASERRRFAKDLHDSLAQQVFYLNLGLDQLADEPALAQNEQISRRIANMRDVAGDIYDQIRHNLSLMRTWEQVNLTEALDDLVRTSAQNYAMTAEVDVQGRPVWLAPHLCEQMYSIVREALNNIGRHARAKHVELELIWQPDRLTLRLVDDGVGFDPQLPVEEGHYGVALMRETMEALDGELRIESAPGQGTVLSASLPLGPGESETQPRRQWPTKIQAAFARTTG